MANILFAPLMLSYSLGYKSTGTLPIDEGFRVERFYQAEVQNYYQLT